ncbi:MAG: SDR family oxidoreductase [Bradyrhizobium sp.]|nr:SDR family oxidoreductase [Bradyrhizobium sp.]
MVKLLFYTICLILRAWSGLSASLARLLTARGIKMGLAARDVNKLKPLADRTGAIVFAADASKPSDVKELFARADSELGEPDVVVYNASSRVSGSLASVDLVLVGQSMP